MNKSVTMRKYQLEHYRKYLLTRVSASPAVIEYIENSLATEDEGVKHTFHKVMIHDWTEPKEALFNFLMEYFNIAFIPIQYNSQNDISSFYTSSLSFILKVIKLDFMCPYQRSMFNVDILFNDKTSADCFENRVTVEDIVSGVVSCRMNDKFELDLSNFCSDPEFQQKQINFYKVNLLSHFKILMLRMGRDTTILNLSNNNLRCVPADIMNFFIRGILYGVNLSNNNLQSLSELQFMSSKLEKLWLEGNPLCDNIDSASYVIQLVKKFPKLSELDDLPLDNKNGSMLPFHKNFLLTPCRKTKLAVEKFITLYFSHYDTINMRSKVDMFYDVNASLSISSNFNDEESKRLPHYAWHSRNALHSNTETFVIYDSKLYKKRVSIAPTLAQFPPTIHDRSTFSVDVIHTSEKSLIIVVNGIFKEKDVTDKENMKMNILHFRRTFVFSVRNVNERTLYHITNEMFHVGFATAEQIQASFQAPIINRNTLALINPEPAETEAISGAFSHITQLNREEAYIRLKTQNWDIRLALKQFIHDFKEDVISDDKFIDNNDENDFSDTSSLVEELLD